MTRPRLALLLALYLAALAPVLRAFVFIDGVPAWADGVVTLELQLGSSPTYSDGTTPNQTAIQAINQWNPSMARLKFEYVLNSGAAKSRTNGKNNVFFDSKMFGTAFPDGVLAVTTGRTDTSGLVEMDVVVNTAWQWDSYRGDLQYPRIDLRRVLAHEFGHVLTLDHPDQHAQWVTALMNSTVSNVEGTQQDDKDGASARYGHGPGNPAQPPVFQPYEPNDVTVLEGGYAAFYAYPTGTQPIALQWLKDGEPIAGATSTSHALSPVTLADAGRYALRATNSGGTSTSREAVLTVQVPQPPTISTHPQGRTVQQTGSFQLYVSAQSNAPVSIQWTKDDVAIPNANSFWYTVNNAQPADSGTYRAIASTSGGSVTSNAAIVTVVPATPPVITMHPTSVTVEEGAWTSLSGSATSEVTVTYQWMRNDVAVPGATFPTLSFSPVSASDAGDYRLVVTNAGGSVSTNTAQLVVAATKPPVINQHPGSRELEATERLELYASATSAVPMTVRWTKNGTPIPGATSSWFTINSVSTNDAGDYQFVATNSAGSTASQVATVTVVPARLPVFVRQPASVTVEAGSNISIDAPVSSAIPVTFQWTRNGVAISGATSSYLYLYDVTLAQAGDYRLVATNAAGSVTSDIAKITVTPAQPPRFISHPSPVTVEAGASFGLFAHATSPSSISYQWTRNGVPIAGATSSYLWVTAASAADDGDFALRATNLAGTSTSQSARVTVTPTRPPTITYHPTPTTAEVGSTAYFSAGFASAVPVTVQWTRDGVALPSNSSTSLYINNVATSDAGHYAMTVTNSAGSATSESALLTVVPTLPPKFTSHPAGGVSEAGTQRSLNVSVQSAVSYTITWTKDGATIPGATSSWLTLSQLSEADSGSYRAVATNAAGSTLSQTATIKVVPLQPPEFLVHPRSFTAEIGGHYGFQVETLSAVTPTYTWYHDGVPIPTNVYGSLFFGPATEADAGVYHVTATNAAGTTKSNSATLEVIPTQPPVFVFQPQPVTAETGSYLSLYANATSVTSITYQWQRDGTPVPNATSASFSISSVTTDHAGTYTLVATNSAGSTTSQPAVVTVLPPGPPRFTIQPVGAFFVPGMQVSLNAMTAGPGPMTYQWYRDEVALSDATSPYLTFASASAADAGAYHLVATNSYGSTRSETASLVPTPPQLPVPTELPNAIAVEGYSTYISIQQPPDRGSPTYQWYKDGVPVAGATGPSLVLNRAARSDAGEYFATITNEAGTVTSSAFTLTVWSSSNEPAPGWSAIQRVGPVVFLLDARGSRIDRYDLATDTQLAPLALSATPTAFAADASHLYVAFGPDIIRCAHDGSSPTPFASAIGNITSMATTDTVLLSACLGDSYASRATIVSHRLADAAPLASSPSLGSFSGAFTVDPARARVYSFTQYSKNLGIGLLSWDILPDGTFGPIRSTSQGWYFPVTARRLFRFPDQPWILDDTGTAYDGVDLTAFGSLGAPVDSIDFTPDGGLVALRGNIISIYDDTLCLKRRITLAAPARSVVVDGADVVALAAVTGGAATVTAERHPLQPPVAAAPIPPANPAMGSWIPDAVATDREGNLLLTSRLRQALYRWDVHQQRFIDAIHIDGFPNQLACVAANNTAYLAFSDQSLVAIDLDGSRTPRSIGAVPWEIATLTAVGNHLVVTTRAPNGGPGTLAVLGAEGEYLALGDTGMPFEQPAWSPGESRLYFATEGWSPFAIASIDFDTDMTPGDAVIRRGSVGTPYNSSMRLLRLSPDGQSIALHSGQILDAGAPGMPMSYVAPFADATWLGGRMFVAGDTAVGVEVRRHEPDLTVSARLELSGRILRLLPAGPGRLVVLTHKHGRTHLTLLDADLNVRNHFEDTPDLTKVALTNLSTRAEVGTGDNIIIAGFVVTGSQSKRILVRAVGPELKRFGVAGVLADPVLTLVSDSGPVAENDNWSTPDGEALKLAFREVFAFGLAEASLDSALVATLAPGKYTAKVSGKDGGQGVALVEAYDLDADPGERRLINISTRAVVGIGDKVLIPGLAIEGTAPKRLLIRAVGPELTRFKVAGVLADPTLQVINADHEIVAANDNWDDDNTEVTTAATAAAYAFRLTTGSRDAALVATLTPGSYTVVVSGVGDTSGVALVEIYEVP